MCLIVQLKNYTYLFVYIRESKNMLGSNQITIFDFNISIQTITKNKNKKTNINVEYISEFAKHLHFLKF